MALTYPERLPCGLPPVDFSKLGALHFAAVDARRYPCFSLALSCAAKGGGYPCALNAAGEVAVQAFLCGQIKYTRIADIMEEALQGEVFPARSYAELAALDAAVRRRAAALLQ